MAAITLHTSIPARVMSVTSVKRVMPMPDGGFASVRIGWLAKCWSCERDKTFGFWQYAEALASRLTHDCYGKPGQKW